MKRCIFNLSVNPKTILAVMILFSGITLKAQETVTDYDGNVYQTVIIGTQVWMKENLRTTKYNNGDTISTTNPATKDIRSESASKYQWIFEDNISDLPVYGRLYTWYAATDSRNVCPTGWHVPDNAEWTTLINFLGGDLAAGGKLKETDTTHWKSPNTGATNESGFTALPGGCRPDNGEFDGGGLYAGDNHHYGVWCSSSENSTISHINLWYDDGIAHAGMVYNGPHTNYRNFGVSIRCMKDSITTSLENIQNKPEVTVYPNPIYDQLTISFGTTPVKETVVQLYSIQGRLVFSKAFYNTSGADVDLAGLPKGMYLIRVMVEGNIFENKIIKTQ